jgi:methionine synthase I (cobalamin-dependent)
MTFEMAARSMMVVSPQNFAVFGNVTKSDFLSANCGIGSAKLLHSIAGMRQTHIDTLLIAKGNCGTPSYVEGAIHYHGTPVLMADYALFARDMGVKIIGGCCETSPDHFAAMAQALSKTLVWPFDVAAMQQALDQPWADIPENLGDADRRKSRLSHRK